MNLIEKLEWFMYLQIYKNIYLNTSMINILNINNNTF